MKNCHLCGKFEMIDVDDIIFDLDGYLFVVKGSRCNNCAEEIVNEAEGQRFITIAKRMSLWGESLKLHRKLSRSARGTMLRIPIDIEKELHLKGNEEVSISKVGNRIVVELE